MAWKNSSTSTGVGAAPTLTATTSSRPSCARSAANSASSACGDLRRELVGHRLAAPARGAPSRARAVERACTAASRCSSGCAASIVSRPALSFSQIRGTAKNHVGRTSGRYCEDLARVRAAGDVQPEDDREVVVRVALGDVRAGSHEMTRAAVGELDRAPRRRCTAVSRLRWVELDALRRPGRARRVDQRQDVVGLDRRASDASTSKPGCGALDVGQRDACPPAPRRRRRSRARGPAGSLRASSDLRRGSACSVMSDLRAGVGDHVLDLLGRVGRCRSRTASRRASSRRGRRGGTRAGCRA